MKNIIINKRIITHLSFIFGMILLLTASCCKEPEPDPEPEADAGHLNLLFDFYVDGNALQTDTMMYVNAAGNHYLIYEIQYFVSSVTIYNNGKETILKGWEKEHYIDSEISNTLSWEVYDKIAPGDYDSLSFTLGFIDADNQSFMFVNPPESNMVWPEYLGGGYHYMKINGKWKPTTGNNRGFAFHLGRGQVYDANNDPISFIDNSFRVSMNHSDFTIAKDKTTKLTIRMNVEEWFKNPTIYDHNTWGGDIMQNQAAMAVAVQNGWNVFELVKP